MGGGEEGQVGRGGGDVEVEEGVVLSAAFEHAWCDGCIGMESSLHWSLEQAPKDWWIFFSRPHLRMEGYVLARVTRNKTWTQ